jgi:mannose-6-phosphate isomerase-like protein (cupin superfamily)
MSTLTVAPTERTLLHRAQHIAERHRLWWPMLRFEPTRRWYARIAADELAETWLLTWLPGQHTDWHDHGESAGAFVVVSGRIREDRADGQHGHFGPATGRTFGGHHVHRVVNDGVVPAVTVHVYAPALTAMTRYASVGGALRAIGVERAGSDW